MKDIYISKQKNNQEPEIPTVNIPDNDYSFNQGNNYAPYTVGTKTPKEHKKKPEYKPPKKKKAKKSKFRKILCVILCILFVFYLLIAGVAAVSGYEKGSLKSNSYISSSQLNSNPLIKNILLIGVDGTDSDEPLRSDSMILVSIDNLHCKIKLSSFMRDSWVQIPGHSYSKLNAACSIGGPQLVVDTIEYNFKVNIDEYVLVDFNMFTQIVDSLGGVDVEVTDAEAKFINRTTRYTVESGSSVHLDGAKALVYCRIRKLDSDYMRTYRQRKVIKALLSKITLSQLPSLAESVFSVMPNIETSMNPLELSALIYRGGISILLFDVESTRIPTDEYSWSATKGSQNVVELNVEANAQYLIDFIYNGSADPVDDNE